LLDFTQQVMLLKINQICHHQLQSKMKLLKMIIKKNFVGKIFIYLFEIKSIIPLDSTDQQRVLHRRIHSDPLFSFPKDSSNLNRSCIISPLPPSSSIPFDDEIKIKEQEIIPSISYFQSDEYGSYASSYDSRGDMFDQNKQPKLTLGQSINSENNNRQSISSQITLIDEKDDNLYNNRLSPIINNDDTILSITSTSPTDQSVTMSTSDYPIRSNLQFNRVFYI